jgi:OmpA-OmpF porin, OOP family
MKNGKAAFAVLGFAAATVFATAAAAQDAGFYIGGAIGQTKAEGDCPSGFTCDLKDNGWKIFGGYKFNPNFAVEGSYGDFGEITLTTGAVTARGELTSLGIAAVGMLPIGERFSLFGKVGWNLTDQKVTVTGPGGSALDGDDGGELNFGFGALFHAMPQLGVRLEWERLEKSEVDMISIGVQYRF